ncbi:hypothetical protein QOT17_003640 [Balamuthia mandrillaris]
MEDIGGGSSSSAQPLEDVKNSIAQLLVTLEKNRELQEQLKVSTGGKTKERLQAMKEQIKAETEKLNEIEDFFQQTGEVSGSDVQNLQNEIEQLKDELATLEHSEALSNEEVTKPAFAFKLFVLFLLASLTTFLVWFLLEWALWKLDMSDGPFEALARLPFDLTFFRPLPSKPS